MRGFVSIWQELPNNKRIVLIAAVAATLFAMAFIGRMASQPDMTLLYAGLDQEAAGEVITSLEQDGVPFEVKGDAIYVPAGQRDVVRLRLAKNGQPRVGAAGYELLDGLNGFSTTSELFDATYWRAKEGELARTILSSSNIQSVRVHIAANRQTAFSRNQQPPSATVTVTARQAIEMGQATSFRYLVALSVPGLEPENVAVIDSDRGLILAPGTDNPVIGMLGDKAAQEQNMARELEQLLQARVGAGNVRVKVALDIDMEREATRERVIDPDSRTIVGRETSENSDQSSGTRGGAVTVASNLPEGDVAPRSDQSTRNQIQTRETLRYDVSEVNREREKMPGAVKRMSIAVLVNNQTTDGTARTAEEIENLRAVVASASGLDEARGDQLTIQALDFELPTTEGTVATASAVDGFIEKHLITVIKLLIAMITTLVLALFVVRPLLKANENAGDDAGTDALEELPQLATAELPMLDAMDTDHDENPSPAARLREIAQNNTDESTALIKSWLDQPEEAA